MTPLKAEEEPVFLLIEGKSPYQIVVPDTYPSEGIERLIRETAELIQSAFVASGAETPIVNEANALDQPGIYLGDTRFARQKNVDIEALKGWEYVQKVVGRDLILAGRDVPNPLELAGVTDRIGRPIQGSRVGTVKAVADFLHDHFGTRFLYPGGDVGIEFQTKERVVVPAGLEVRKTPALKFGFDTSFGRVGANSLTRDLYLIANNYMPNTEFEMTAHSYPRAIPVEEFRESHPEYFALIGDKRTVEMENWEPRGMGHYCISNPEARELIYQDMLRSLDLGFDLTVLAQQDGFRACQCQDCHDLYDTGDNWTEKLWIFHRNLAERLLEDRPEKKVMLLSYGLTWSPPSSFSEFPENAIVWLCRTSPEILEEWREVDVPAGFAAYIYSWGTYNTLGYTPQQTPVRMEQLARKFADLNVHGVFMDGFGHLFGLQGPAYYVFGRMFDDPDHHRAADLLEEYYESAFGEALVPMRRFFETLHHALQFYVDAPIRYTDAYDRTRAHDLRMDPMRSLQLIYSPEILNEMAGHLERARELANSEKVKSRLALVGLEFDYVRLTAAVAHLHAAYELAPDLASRERLLQAIDERNAFLGPHWFAKNPETGALGTQLRGQIEGWPEMRPFVGHSRTHIWAPRRYGDTPVVWDTEEMRRAPLPGAKQWEIARAPAPVDFESAFWEDVDAVEILQGSVESSSLPTLVRAVYDDTNLYFLAQTEVAVALEDLGELSRMEDVEMTESLQVVVDPLEGRDAYFRFAVGPAEGTRYEAAYGLIDDPLHPLYQLEDSSWAGAWEHQLRWDSETRVWTALITLPYASFEVDPPAPGTVWRGNFGRTQLSETTGEPTHGAWSMLSDSGRATDRHAFGEWVFRGAIGENGSGSTHPLTVLRHSLYESSFALPDEWKTSEFLLDGFPGDWQFREDPAGQGEAGGWHLADFDDSTWSEMPVPAFWAETEVGDYIGNGWYRTTFVVPTDWAGHPVELLFGSVDEQAWVYVNGRQIREHSAASEGLPEDQIWDTPFIAVVEPDALNYGEENVLAVRVYASRGNAGIWRPVLARRKDQ